MDTSGLLAGNVNISISPVKIDTMSLVELCVGLALTGVTIIVAWAVFKSISK